MNIRLKHYWCVTRDFLTKRASTAAVALDLILVSVFYVFLIAHIPTQNGDNIEHIHSSFLVFQGNVPYRDFFQHHNPLLWFLFAPLVGLFAYNSIISEVVCLISFLVFLKSLVYVYRICAEFLCDKFWALYATAIVAIPSYKLYAVDFRPDNYMVFALVAGIYYYFSYLNKQKAFSLIVAFLWFTIAFLFAQKAVFPLFVLGLSGIYFWFSKNIKTSDMFKALILPLFLIGGFVCYLCYYDIFNLYLVSNFTFNLNLVKGFEMNKIVEFPTYMAVLMWVGFVGTIASCFYKNKYWMVCAILFVSEFIQRKFYFSPYSYYFWWLVYLAAIVGIPFVCKIFEKNKIVVWGAVSILYLMLYRATLFYKDILTLQLNKQYLPNYIVRNISPCDYVFNGDGMMYNIFGKDPAYYWQLIGQLDVIGEQTGIAPKPDINKLILMLKPKFIYGKSYFNKFSDESGRPEIVHYINQDIVETYYQQTPYSSIYILKPIYDKRLCVYNPITDQWNFVEKIK